MGKTEGQGPIGMHRLSRENNMKMNHKESIRQGMDLTNLDEDRNRWRALLNAIMKFEFHKMQRILYRLIFFKKDSAAGR